MEPYGPADSTIPGLVSFDRSISFLCAKSPGDKPGQTPGVALFIHLCFAAPPEGVSDPTAGRNYR